MMPDFPIFSLLCRDAEPALFVLMELNIVEPGLSQKIFQLRVLVDGHTVDFFRSIFHPGRCPRCTRCR